MEVVCLCILKQTAFESSNFEGGATDTRRVSDRKRGHLGVKITHGQIEQPYHDRETGLSLSTTFFVLGWVVHTCAAVF